LSVTGDEQDNSEDTAQDAHDKRPPHVDIWIVQAIINNHTTRTVDVDESNYQQDDKDK